MAAGDHDSPQKLSWNSIDGGVIEHLLLNSGTSTAQDRPIANSIDLCKERLSAMITLAVKSEKFDTKLALYPELSGQRAGLPGALQRSRIITCNSGIIRFLPSA